jgi:tRNA dimethylallyltransferase
VQYLIVIGGATATGKTALAVWLAQQLGTEILSADSRQFYRGMDIGTAKPGASERAAVRHHFIDSLDVSAPYSAGDFERDALQVLENLFRVRDTAILTGGSGLFIQAVCEGLDLFPDITETARTQVAEGAERGGIAWLQETLRALDPVYYRQVDVHNPARLRRALEVCLSAGAPYSDFLKKEKPKRAFQPIYILLDLPREALYRRIDERVDAMIHAGLEAEARALLPFRQLPALQTVGYTEWFDYFDGRTDRQTAIEKIKQHSRNYAKRQATWFRKHGHWAVFAPDAHAAVLEYVRQQMG